MSDADFIADEIRSRIPADYQVAVCGDNVMVSKSGLGFSVRAASIEHGFAVDRAMDGYEVLREMVERDYRSADSKDQTDGTSLR